MSRTLFLLLTFSPFALQTPVLGKQTSYDENDARSLLNLAAAAYGTEHQGCLNKFVVTIQKEYSIFRTFASFEAHQILMKITKNCDQLDSTCEAFSQLLLEGWDSLQPGVDFFDMGMVNRYFFNAHLTLWPEIEQVLVDPQYKGYSVDFTGHSLGGALASLAAARTVKQGYRQGNLIKMITFGQPRVGSLQYAKSFDGAITNAYRVVFRRDIVPHLPACKKNQSYVAEFEGGSVPCDENDNQHAYHHSTEIWYPDSMDHGSYYMECLGNPKNEDFSCSDKLKFYYDQTSSYVWDHRHYFGVKVPSYGKEGCNEDLKEGKPGVFESVLCWFMDSPSCEDHIEDENLDKQPVVPFEIVNRTMPVSSSAVKKILLATSVVISLLF